MFYLANNINKIWSKVRICTIFFAHTFVTEYYIAFQQEIIPAKSLHNRDMVSVYFSHFACMMIYDTKETLIYANLHISQHGWVLINIFHATAKA